MSLENRELCAKCKGACCKTMGCHYSPSDFKDLSYEGLKKEIEKGYISIDYWEGNPFKDNRDIPRAYFLRIKNKGCEIVDASFGGVCSLLTENGCKLTFNNRPKGGRDLIPAENGRCRSLYSKQDCAIEWYKYNHVLTKLAKEYETENNNLENLIKRLLNFK